MNTNPHQDPDPSATPPPTPAPLPTASQEAIEDMKVGSFSVTKNGMHFSMRSNMKAANLLAEELRLTGSGRN